MNSKTALVQRLWAKQQISNNDVDYNVWGQKRTHLQQVADITHSCLFAVDVFLCRYDFASSGFSELFGYEQKLLNSIENQGDFFESMVHPEDLDKLKQLQIEHSQFIYSLEPKNRNHYSNTYKFRMRNSHNKYLNVMSRQQVIQEDANGKAWIILGEVNLLPEQRPLDGHVQGITLNLKTGQLIRPISNTNNEPKLSDREVEVLRLIQSGYLSKEIADKLCISLNTVNNHRKNMLQKLHVSNSIEALNEAVKRGILQ